MLEEDITLDLDELDRLDDAAEFWWEVFQGK